MMLESVPLSALAEVRSGGGAPQDPHAFTLTGYPFVRAGSLPKLLEGASEESLEGLEPATAEKHGLSLFPAGTVLFAKSGMSATKGYVYRLRLPAYVVNHLAALVPHDADDGAFLVRVLQRFPPTVLVKDPAYPSIRLGDIENMKVFAPPDSAGRRRIAEVLDRAEALRAKRRAALAQLETLTQAIFLDLFGDPASNPKRFPISSFTEACERMFKGAFDLKASSYQADGIPFIRIANIQRNTIDLTDAVYLDERTHKQYQGSELVSGDLVFSKVGTIDRIAVIPNNIPRCNISQNNVGAKLRHTVALPVYALALLTTPYALGKIRAGSKKAVQDKLVLEELRRLPFMLPPIELQRELARREGAVEKLKATQRASLVALDALFATLQHRAFRGEL